MAKTERPAAADDAGNNVPRTKPKRGKRALANMMRIVDPGTFILPSYKLMQQLAEIAVGKSEIAADKKDWRFQDKAWTENPVYRRLAQSYLAMSEVLEDAIPKDLEGDARSRAELIAAIVVSALSPTNTLLGNPAALARTRETRGANLRRGVGKMIADMKKGGGLPSQVDASGFEVGVNLAATPGKVVLRTDMFELIHYKPSTATVHQVPVVLIPPQIGRYYFTDLAPGRSFVEYAVASGLQFFTVSWRNPSAAHRDWGLVDYMWSSVQALDVVESITGHKGVNIVGFCAGGILSSIVAAYLQAKGDTRIKSLSVCVTMLDFTSDASIGAFRLPSMLKAAKDRSRSQGVLPGKDLQKVFAWMRPNDLVWNYWVNNYLMGDDPPAFDILAWNSDSTNLPARLHEDFLTLFDENPLARGSDYQMLGERVDLSKVDCDTFLVGAINDHITPWKACYRSVSLLGGKTTFALSNGGHIAALVNPPDNPKAFHWIAPGMEGDAEAWLKQAEKQPGSWWVGWAKWCAERAGRKVRARKVLGSADYPPIADAPGDYVREEC